MRQGVRAVIMQHMPPVTQCGVVRLWGIGGSHTATGTFAALCCSGRTAEKPFA